MEVECFNQSIKSIDRRYYLLRGQGLVFLQLLSHMTFYHIAEDELICGEELKLHIVNCFRLKVRMIYV